MARIKVTGYIETDLLNEADVDLEDPTGLSQFGYEALIEGLGGNDSIPVADLDDIEVELID